MTSQITEEFYNHLEEFIKEAIILVQKLSGHYVIFLMDDTVAGICLGGYNSSYKFLYLQYLVWMIDNPS